MYKVLGYFQISAAFFIVRGLVFINNFPKFLLGFDDKTCDKSNEAKILRETQTKNGTTKEIDLMPFPYGS